MRMLIQFTEVEINLLYELKRPHTIVDFIGNLTVDDGSEWLEFIQILLKSYYAKQRKLGDIFQCNSGNEENKSWSFYTKYRHKYNVQFTDHKKKSSASIHLA